MAEYTAMQFAFSAVTSVSLSCVAAMNPRLIIRGCPPLLEQNMGPFHAETQGKLNEIGCVWLGTWAAKVRDEAPFKVLSEQVWLHVRKVKGRLALSSFVL